MERINNSPTLFQATGAMRPMSINLLKKFKFLLLTINADK